MGRARCANSGSGTGGVRSRRGLTAGQRGSLGCCREGPPGGRGTRTRARQAKEARAWAAEEARKQEEEWRVREEEDQLAVERDLCEEVGPSQERAPWRQLFLPSLDSARSPEEEERVAGPSQDKGKGHVLTSEEV